MSGPTAHTFDTLAQLHMRCLTFVTQHELPTLATQPGDVPGALIAATSTLYLACLNESIR